jgi:hypothetical protein
MTLWSLLIGISFTTPVYAGGLAGHKVGGVGTLIGVLIGLVFGFGGAWGLLTVGRRAGARLESIQPQSWRAVAIIFLDIGAVVWIFILGALAAYITTLLVHLLAT